MALTVQQIQSVAHLSLVLGVLRRLEVATVLDRLIPPHPAYMLSCGRGAVIQQQVRLYLRACAHKWSLKTRELSIIESTLIACRSCSPFIFLVWCYKSSI